MDHSQSEKRFKRLGSSIEKRVLLVVFTVRRIKNGKETIRIIIARQASRKERKAYSG
ncbi:MAG: BrnT family toxin [Nitrospiria bacterium]